MTHHTTTLLYIVDNKYVFQSYYIEEYILIEFLYTKKVNCSWSIISVAGWNFAKTQFCKNHKKTVKVSFNNAPPEYYQQWQQRIKWRYYFGRSFVWPCH